MFRWRWFSSQASWVSVNSSFQALEQVRRLQVPGRRVPHDRQVPSSDRYSRRSCLPSWWWGIGPDPFDAGYVKTSGSTTSSTSSIVLA